MKNIISVFSGSQKSFGAGRSVMATLAASGILLGAQYAYAAPAVSSISGSLSQGQSVTISGSGFGTKSPAAPVLWAPFDTNLNPSPLGRVTSWVDNNCVEFTPNGRSGGGVKTVDSCGKIDTAELGISTSSIGYYFNTLGQNSYIFRHRKKAYTGDVNLKSLEVMVSGDYTNGNNIVFNHSSSQWISQNVTPDSYCYLKASPVNNQWGTEEFITQTSPTAGGQANINWYANGQSLMGSEACQISYRGTNGSNMNNIKPLFHGDYNTSSGSMSTTPEYWDSLYIDNTWSRVILGNASTFTASTQREIQIPTAWSSAGNSVTVSVNAGAFTTGQQVYLYVIDSTGSVNSTGYSVTIGNSGSTTVTPPAPKLNLIQ